MATCVSQGTKGNQTNCWRMSSKNTLDLICQKSQLFENHLQECRLSVWTKDRREAGSGSGEGVFLREI